MRVPSTSVHIEAIGNKEAMIKAFKQVVYAPKLTSTGGSLTLPPTSEIVMIDFGVRWTLRLSNDIVGLGCATLERQDRPNTTVVLQCCRRQARRESMTPHNEHRT
jgi:hypothetical protein